MCISALTLSLELQACLSSSLRGFVISISRLTCVSKIEVLNLIFLPDLLFSRFYFPAQKMLTLHQVAGQRPSLIVFSP